MEWMNNDSSVIEMSSNKLLVILIFFIRLLCVQKVGILHVILIGLFGQGKANILPATVPKNKVFKLLHN